MSTSLFVFALFIPSIFSQPPDGGMGPGGDGDMTQNAGESNTASTETCDLYGRDATYQEGIVGEVRTIASSGCPNHYSGCIKPDICTDDDPKTEAGFLNINISIPAFPCIAESTFDVLCVEGMLGVMLNGVPLYGQDGGQCADAVLNEGETFDACGGHATPDGDYHYHLVPACLADQVGDYATPNPNGHSPQIGWALDGFPVYGRHALNGDLMYPCNHSMANGSDCLDECNGHSHHAIDGFTYHYHVSGVIGDLKSTPLSPLPSTDFNPYTIGCFKGVPFDWDLIEDATDDTQTSCSSLNGYTNTYTPSALQGVIEVYNATYPNGTSSDDLNSDSNAPSMAPTASTTLSGQSGALSHCTVSVLSLILSYILIIA